jgi:hypothetical protein
VQLLISRIPPLPADEQENTNPAATVSAKILPPVLQQSPVVMRSIQQADQRYDNGEQ